MRKNVWSLAIGCCCWGVAAAQTPASPASAPGTEAAIGVVSTLEAEAAKLRPLVKTELAAAFLGAVRLLPEPSARTVYRNRGDGRALTPAAFAALPETEQGAFAKREYPPAFFYYTGYGSPLVYARPLDVLAQRLGPAYSVDGRKILDFGYGTIGHLRLLAALGARASGVDVEPVFGVLYSEQSDTGPSAGEGQRRGNVAIHTGRWPAEPALAEAIGKDGPYDLFISKNTLKAGYIHPAREVDPKFLVKLGVDDETFVREVYNSLKPGGVFMIYNICPAQAPADKPYLPHADGKCPFDRAMLEKAGFKVLDFDVVDTPAVLEFWKRLGYDEGKTSEEAAKDLFVWYSIMQRGE